MEEPQIDNQETLPDKFPKQSLFILVYTLISEIGNFGITSLMAVYFKEGLLMTENESIMVFHGLGIFQTIFPLFGAFVSDSLFGKFKTIVFGKFISFTGLGLLWMGTITSFNMSPILLTVVALIVVYFGGGFIGPCFSALGGEQFKLPEQEKHLTLFFRILYWAMNVGAFLGMSIMPIVRQHKCMGKDHCYPMAFGISISIMLFAFVIFLIGGIFYVKREPKENMLVVCTKCISHAIVQKCKSTEKKGHWLDYARDKFDPSLIHDIKVVFRLVVLFLTLPVFWCLFDQQNSDWVLLATKLDGDIGFYTILPEQIQTFNPILILVLIPIFHSVIDPIFIKLHFCTKPLKKMALGFFLTSVSFILSGLIYFAVYREFPKPPSEGTIHIRAYNPEADPAKIIVEGIEDFPKIDLDPFDNKEFFNIKFKESSKEVRFDDVKVSMSEGKSYAVYNFAQGLEVHEEVIEKPETDSIPRITSVVASKSDLLFKSKGKGEDLKVEAGNLTQMKIDAGTYKLQSGDKKIDEEIRIKIGGVYLVMANFELKKIKNIVLVKENTIHMLWMIPQFIVITISEVLVSVTLLEFTYSHAPVSMKSIVRAIQTIINASGNILIVVITLIKFQHRGYNAMIYAILIVLDMFILLLIERKYKYKAVEDEPL